MTFKHVLSKLGVFVCLLALTILAACSSSTSQSTSSNTSTANNVSNQESQSSTEESILIRIAHVSSEDHPYHIAATKFKELIEERSNGAITVQIFPNGQLGSEEMQ